MRTENTLKTALLEGRYAVTGSVVTFKTDPEELKHLVDCFESGCVCSRLMVIDNSPTRKLEKECKQIGVDYHYTGANIGFGAAHNIAIEAVRGTSKYHVVMNSDISFGPEVLPRLMEFCDLNPSVGLAMPKILNPDGSIQRLCKRLPAPFDIAARRLFPRPVKALFRRRMDNFELRQFDLGSCLSVPFLSGCFMFLRTSALARVGLFDPRYFMYFEDADLSRRIRRHYDTVYYPSVSVIHEHGRGTYKSGRLFLRSIQSAVRYFNKWGWVGDRGRKWANESCGPAEYLMDASDF